ncbi:Sel1-like repeat-containing protein kinase family protein [Chitinimonas sp. BJYL2]|uniref:Sel1-like repeat-containing protein kinase family protein n=1 Tax=Chitinimonas sp. BJYL2 TaxID=2976696 RepID=UPI0022B4B773|nr:Sel1-like repeat-containing protein kinase family protein [Chitinimonas sp. BJYL2]
MTDNVEVSTSNERPIQLEKFLSPRGTERWCKRLSAAYPAADYWLCHEARILQGFQRDQRHAARFVGVDLDEQALISEAAGHPLTHWLATPVGELEHPFQRSSELVKLILACLKALQHLSHSGLVHGGLRPDVLVLRQNDDGAIDYDQITVIDFGVARNAQQRIEKPLFVDLASQDAAYMAPAMRDAIHRDWQTYARLVGEPGKTGWYELSETARRQYTTVLIPDLAINTLDWRVDLYALGHWFKQISLHRIDYYKDAHQETLPALIRKMQKPVLQGGFTSLDACIKAFEALEIDKRPLVIAEAPQTTGVYSMHPAPVLHPVAPGNVLPSIRLDDEFSPSPAGVHRRDHRAEPSHGKGKLIGIGIGLIVVAAVGAALLSSKDQHASPTPEKDVEQGEGASVSSHGAPEQDAKPIAQAEPAAPDATVLAGLSLADLRRAAEAGDPAAQTQLGLRYRKGQGVPADNELAVSWYRKAADQHHAEAQAYLGFMFMTGRGIRKDDGEAVRYSQLAADQGNPTGQYNLALLYLSGRGVPLDKLSAYRLLKQAAVHDPSAKARLAEVERLLTPAQREAAAQP